MLKEFKEFAMRGSVVDLAIGVVIGAAFGKVISSLVADVIMPPLGLVLGKVDFSNLFVDLSGKGYASLSAAKQAGAPTINYGIFLNTIIDFIIVAFALFLLIQLVQKARKKEDAKPAEPPAPSEEVKLLGEIRDLLKDKS